MKKTQHIKAGSSSSKLEEDSSDIIALKEELSNLRSRVKTLERGKQLAELSSQSKSEFIAKLSHDLRTPLHAILSYSRFGIDKIDRVDKEKILSYFSKIEFSGKKLQTMLNDLVDLAKLESGMMAFQFYNCRIPLIITSLENEFSEELDTKNITLKSDIQEELPAVCCDQNKIAQVITTFLKNAIDLSPEKGTIEVRMALDKIEGIGQQDAIRVTIEDQREKLLTSEQLAFFEHDLLKENPHHHFGHQDIQIAIAHEIIKHHSGVLWAENLAEKGVSHGFLLPVDQEGLAPPRYKEPLEQ